MQYKTRRGIEGPPDLVVEILSPTTARQDRGIKRERYVLFGIPEYWIVDIDRRQVEVHRLSKGADQVTIVADRLVWQPVEGGPALELNVAELLGNLDWNWHDGQDDQRVSAASRPVDL